MGELESLTYPEIKARMADIAAQMERLNGRAGRDGSLSAPDESRWEALDGEFEALNKRKRFLEAESHALALKRAAVQEAFRMTNNVERGNVDNLGGDDRGSGRRGGNPWGDERMAMSDRARRCLDAMARDKRVEGVEHAVEKVSHSLDGRDGGDLDAIARWTVVASDPDYLAAVIKTMADPILGHTDFEPAELRAWQRARQYRVEQRAMSLSDVAGGFLIPFQLDPSIILGSDGSVDPIRRLARQVIATGDVWNGVSSAGVTMSFDAEAAEVSDDTPVLAQPSITVRMMRGFVPISIEAWQDAANVANEVAALLADAKMQLEAQVFLEGLAASNQPVGLLTTLAAGQKIATATADVLVLADVPKPQNALPPRHQPRAQWLANLATINAIGGFETAAGARRYPEVSDGRLLNRPLNEASYMDTAGATALAGNDSTLLYGDFSKYVIADRAGGSALEFVPHLFGVNGRPTGQRGWFYFSRVGADSVDDNAFRLLTA